MYFLRIFIVISAFGEFCHTASALNLRKSLREIKKNATEAKVSFLLWTRSNPNNYEIIVNNDETSFQSSNFNLSVPTKFLLHGYNEDALQGWIISLKKVFLSREEVNVVSVDWKQLSNVDYFNAVKNVRIAAQELARFLDGIIRFGSSLDDIHIIGFSLGAQVPAFIGRNLQNGSLPRITGLDPAGIGFNTDNVTERLDPSDARFVEVIHGNGLLQGYSNPVGHADFFPNGGLIQAGCGVDILGSCSHQRAHAYYLESITSDVGFNSVPCKSWELFQDEGCAPSSADVLMGFPCPTSARGSFYLYTNESPPYAKG